MFSGQVHDKRNNISADVGVVIAAYNAEKTIEAAIKSVVNQTSGAWNLAVVDDGSTDGTYNIALRCAANNPKIKVIHQENSGVALARNAGIDTLECKWITYLDADDSLVNTWCEKMLDFAESNAGYALYGCNYLMLNDGPPWLIFPHEVVSEITLDMMFEHWYMGLNGTLLSKQLFDSYGGFRKEYYNEDGDLAYRIYADGHKGLFFPEALYLYDACESGRKSSNRIRQISSNIHTIADILATHNFDSEQTKLAQDYIDLHQHMLDQIIAKQEESARLANEEAQVRALRDRIESVVGNKRVDSALKIIHRISWVARPLRLWWADHKAKKLAKKLYSDNTEHSD